MIDTGPAITGAASAREALRRLIDGNPPVASQAVREAMRTFIDGARPTTEN